MLAPFVGEEGKKSTWETLLLSFLHYSTHEQKYQMNEVLNVIFCAKGRNAKRSTDLDAGRANATKAPIDVCPHSLYHKHRKLSNIPPVWAAAAFSAAAAPFFARKKRPERGASSCGTFSCSRRRTTFRPASRSRADRAPAPAKIQDRRPFRARRRASRSPAWQRRDRFAAL